MHAALLMCLTDSNEGEEPAAAPCNLCGGAGHFEIDCPLAVSDADEPPAYNTPYKAARYDPEDGSDAGDGGSDGDSAESGDDGGDGGDLGGGYGACLLNCRTNTAAHVETHVNEMQGTGTDAVAAYGEYAGSSGDSDVEDDPHNSI